MLARPPETPLPAICAWNTFQVVVDHFKRATVPAFVTRDTLPTTVSPDLRARVITSLRALKLIDENGRVQQTFLTLVATRGTSQWQNQLRSLMAAAYPYLIGVNLGNVDTGTLRKAFLTYLGRETDNLSKCEAFYINMAQAAGVQLSAPLLKRAAAAKTMADVKAAEKQDPAKPAMVLHRTTGLLSANRPLRRPPPLQTGKIKEDEAVSTPKPATSEHDRVEKIMDLLRMFTDEGLPAKELAAVMTLLDYVKRKAAA